MLLEFQVQNPNDNDTECIKIEFIFVNCYDSKTHRHSIHKNKTKICFQTHRKPMDLLLQIIGMEARHHEQETGRKNTQEMHKRSTNGRGAMYRK